MVIPVITPSAESLFLQDISADDIQEEIFDHQLNCSCHTCQLFERLLQLEKAYQRYIQGLSVQQEYLEICREKYLLYHSDELDH